MMILTLSLLLISFSGFSKVHSDLAVAMVPKSKIFEIYGRDYIIKTPSGSKIEIEFYLDGNFKQASGRNLGQGDELEPGFGLISLSSVAQKMKAPGVNLKGHWKLEYDKKLGWVYDLASDFLVCAKSGKVLKTSPSTSENASVDIYQKHHQTP